MISRNMLRQHVCIENNDEFDHYITENAQKLLKLSV